MKLLQQVLVLTFLDLILIWFYVRWESPDPSMGIGVLVVVPAVLILNLLISLLMFVFKRKYSLVFLINSIISAIIMYNFYIMEINRHTIR